MFHIYFEIRIKFLFKLAKKNKRIKCTRILSAKMLLDETSAGRVYVFPIYLVGDIIKIR